MACDGIGGVDALLEWACCYHGYVLRYILSLRAVLNNKVCTVDILMVSTSLQ